MTVPYPVPAMCFSASRFASGSDPTQCWSDSTQDKTRSIRCAVYDQTLGIDCPKAQKTSKEDAKPPCFVLRQQGTKSAEGRFRSFETGDYSNEIMGLASAAGFCRLSQGINRDEPDATRAMLLNSCMHAA
jgi:hypothetical protein